MLRRADASNGFESWRKLHNRYRIPLKARAVARLTQILEPSGGMERGSFEDRLASWADGILKSEKETNSKLSDDVKIAVLMNKKRGHLQEQLRLQAASLTRYHAVKDVMTNYIKTTQICITDPTRGPDATEVGNKSQQKGTGT